MGILGTKNKNTVANTLAQEGLSMFRIAIDKLKKSSENASSLVEENTGIISTLTEENKIMNKLVSDNTRVIENISAIINPE